jgi:hypothetical protein
VRLSDPLSLWQFLPFGYLLTVAIEVPVLCIGLTRRHPLRDRIIAGVWLTAVTYPIVVIAMPLALGPHASRLVYLALAETFAPLAECGLFYLAYLRPIARDDKATLRDFAAIVLANLASFACGELLWSMFPAVSSQ